MLCLPIMQCANAQDAKVNEGQPAQTMHFELPAQPLAQALQSFGRMTELVVLASAPLLEGRTSAPVSGDFAPRDALQRTLAGTGLEADFTGPDEALIVAQTTPPAPVVAPAPVETQAPAADLPVDGIANDEQRTYAAMVQQRLTEALCTQPLTRPGGYRVVAQLRIDDKGAVRATELVASSGSAPRDAAIVQALRSLRFDDPPPPGLAEPVTILLRPAGNGVHINCPQTDKRG